MVEESERGTEALALGVVKFVAIYVIKKIITSIWGLSGCEVTPLMVKNLFFPL